jgi:PhnB protein
MNGFSVLLGCSMAAEGRHVFDLLAEGGPVTMPMERSFRAKAFRMLVDKFGTPWIINGAMTRT